MRVCVSLCVCVTFNEMIGEISSQPREKGSVCQWICSGERVKNQAEVTFLVISNASSSSSNGSIIIGIGSTRQVPTSAANYRMPNAK